MFDVRERGDACERGKVQKTRAFWARLVAQARERGLRHRRDTERLESASKRLVRDQTTALGVRPREGKDQVCVREKLLLLVQRAFFEDCVQVLDRLLFAGQLGMQTVGLRVSCSEHSAATGEDKRIEMVNHLHVLQPPSRSGTGLVGVRLRVRIAMLRKGTVRELKLVDAPVK